LERGGGPGVVVVVAACTGETEGAELVVAPGDAPAGRCTVIAHAAPPPRTRATKPAAAARDSRDVRCGPRRCSRGLGLACAPRPIGRDAIQPGGGGACSRDSVSPALRSLRA